MCCVLGPQAAESGGAAGGELVTDAEGHMHVEKVVQVRSSSGGGGGDNAHPLVQEEAAVHADSDS
jgi:hypothetical protein